MKFTTPVSSIPPFSRLRGKGQTNRCANFTLNGCRIKKCRENSTIAKDSAQPAVNKTDGALHTTSCQAGWFVKAAETYKQGVLAC